MASWDGVPLAELQARWRVPRLQLQATTGSTNDDARALALQGSPAGTVVIAEHQSAGRGREGRTWEAEAGQSLLLSVILRPGRHRVAGIAAVTPLRVGIAVATAIQRCAGLSPRLKWPNDVLAGDGRKLAGILCEAATGPDGAFVVAGIGVNVRQRQWPESLAGTATSLLEAAGRAPARPELAGFIIDALRPFLLAGPSFDDAELRSYLQLDALRHRAIDIDGVPAGIADGIEPDGALRVVTPAGVRVFRTGTVRVVAEPRRARPPAIDGRAPATP